MNANKLPVAAALCVAFLFGLAAAASAVPQVSRDINTYVLFAYDQLTWKGGNLATDSGYIVGGNIGVNYPLSQAPSNPTSFSMNFGTTYRGIMSPEYQAVADSVRADDAQDIFYYLFANSTNASFGATVNNPNPDTLNYPDGNYPFTTPIIATASLPVLPFTPSNTRMASEPDLTVAQDAVVSLTPGDRRDVRFNDGAVVTLTDGLYNMRSLSMGVGVTVNVTDNTTLQIDEDWFLNNNLSFGLGTNSGARVYIGAYGINVNTTRVTTFSKNNEIHAQYFAPTGWLDLGGGNELYGRYWAQRITGDPNNNVYFEVVPEPSGAIALIGGLGALGSLLIRKRR